MNKVFILFYVFFLLPGCSRTIPRQKDYLGVYRIPKITENSEKIKNTMLTQIELTESFYIMRIDRDGDNKFSEDEISKSTYLFAIDENNNPYITSTGNDALISLLPDKYYDLLLRRVDETGLVTTMYMIKVR